MGIAFHCPQTMKFSTFVLLATAVTGTVASRPGSSLRFEHPGRVFSKSHSQGCCVQGVVHDEEPRGHLEEYSDETLYITSPPRRYGGRHGMDASAAIIYLTDIFGLGIPNNKLLADSLASSGYLVVVPDLFRGDPVPENALSDPDSDFDFPAWQERHPSSEVNAIIDSTIETMRGDFGVTKLGAVGYCFGGPYVAQLLANGSFVSAGFTAHPSGVELEQWQNVSKPISVAYGALDEVVPQEDRHEAENAFINGNKTFEISLYAEVEHGFAVRTDLSNKMKAFAQESAYFQAVRWLDAWVKDVPVLDD